MSDHSRLVLGTAQLGMTYGIANRTGQPDREAAHEIVKTAWENGVCEFDTAQAYGQSEQILGQIIKDHGIANQAKITTKPHPNLNHLDQGDMMQAIEQSLDRLHVNKLHCLMLHREEMLNLWQEGLSEILGSIIQQGIAEYIGVSVYSPRKALQAIRTEGIKIVQLPTNILDRRFVRAGVFEAAATADKRIYIRSVFLQGLLLMEPDMLPPHMMAAKPILDELHAISLEKKVHIRQISLAFIKATQPDAKLIIGSETATQLKEVINDAEVELSKEIIKMVCDKFDSVNENIINPTLWAQ
jgi:aryl-alcohol dehydrogenase-like predicted oxidoreductase